ncbi:MAG: hypothetical protein JSV49_08250 [Thermoplasmata archaeon]|nr:MAG: hypothetical protein JSV49_08250 [Thermoplasmata archaeon]
MPRKSKKSPQSLASERQKKMEELDKLLEEAGKGLMKSQVELKHVPWRVTWERQDMLMERQERIIELLESMLAELKKKKK